MKFLENVVKKIEHNRENLIVSDCDLYDKHTTTVIYCKDQNIKIKFY